MPDTPLSTLHILTHSSLPFIETEIILQLKTESKRSYTQVINKEARIQTQQSD